MDRSADDTTAWDSDGRHRTAVAEAPPATAAPAAPGRGGGSPSAHWADRDSLYKRPDRPFRRPPAENSFPDPSDTASGLPRQVSPDDTSGRHWTGVGEPTRRPRTSDRGETTSPAPRPRKGFGARGATPAPAAEPPAAGREAAARRDFARAERRSGGRAARPAPGTPAAPADDPVQRVGAARRKAAAASSPPAAVTESAAEGSFFGPNPPDAPGAAAASAAVGDLTGEGREIRPHRAARRDAPPGPAAEPAPVRGRRLAVVGLIVSGLLAGGAGALYAVGHTGTGGLATILRSDATATGERTVAAPLAGRAAATFDVTGVTELVTLRTEDLGNDLYRITAAEDSGVLPAPVVAADTVRLGLTPQGDAAGGPVEIVLSNQVEWALRLTGAVQESRIDFSAGRLSGVELRSAARRVELGMGAATKTVGVTVTGTIDELVLRAPADNPVRLKLPSGAKTVAAGQKTLRDVEPGATFTPKGWNTDGRYDVTVPARPTLVSVEAK
ncbi:hypothetical protein [Spirilliplanes yamanashiensis]|uniref:Uncharacterized protein n=1 Tax=Spirilliplanes yamanashiensis TaxID=42233 RepID=A0A8J3YD40_9ACTN|nr:hypothetical protein [Spirilliplanes yamanashiensis]MDP9816357.1 hypothetical protein [Spirilliplanes yamanashiensis]GIJ05884.1 hypothetical protein Sya03_52360 [Spirilliplanes yamanashiensis]